MGGAVGEQYSAVSDLEEHTCGLYGRRASSGAPGTSRPFTPDELSTSTKLPRLLILIVGSGAHAAAGAAGAGAGAGADAHADAGATGAWATAAADAAVAVLDLLFLLVFLLAQLTHLLFG